MTTARVRPIGGLPLAGELDGTEIVPGLQGGAAVGMTAQKLADLAARGVIIPGAAEILAGLGNGDLSNFLKYISVSWFGANGTLGDSARIQAAVNFSQAQDIPIVVIPRLPGGAAYQIDATIINPGVKILGLDGHRLQKVGIGSMFRSGETPSLAEQAAGLAQFAADAPAGSRTLSLAAGQGSRVTKDDLLVLYSEALGLPEQPRPAEFARVQSVTGDTVTLAGPTSFQYLVASNARLLRPSMISGVVYENLNIRMDPSVPPVNGGVFDVRFGIDLRFCVGAIVRGVSVRENAGPAIFLTGCYNTTIDSPSAYDLGSADEDVNGTSPAGLGGYGYGVIERALNEGMIMTGAHYERIRHGYTTGAGFPEVFKYGMPMGSQISDSVHIDAKASGWDTHESGRNITFTNCKTKGGRHNGFQIRSAFACVINCSVEDVLGAGVYLAGASAAPGFAGNDCIVDGFTATNTNLAQVYSDDWRENGCIRDQGLRNNIRNVRINSCGGPALSTNGVTRDGQYRNITAVDPCQLTVSFKQAVVIQNSARDLTEIEGLRVISDGKVVDLVRATNAACIPTIRNLVGSGHTGGDFTGPDGNARVRYGGNGLALRGTGRRFPATISSNTIDLTDARGSFIDLLPSSGTADTLNHIRGGQNGDSIRLRAQNSTFTITVANNAASAPTGYSPIRLKGNTNAVLTSATNGHFLVLNLYFEGGAWYEDAR